MSELSAAAAEALGIPEALVQRSAAARAAETGAGVDEVLAAWAGGGDVPVASAEAVAAPPSAGETPTGPPASAEAIAAPPSAGEPPTGPPAERGDKTRPPVLVGEADNPIGVLVGAVALFLAIFLVGLVGPALPAEIPGARSSDLPFSEAALRGQHIYRSVGCASCHTQMVRPVVADVGLGAVTLSDSNQVLGTRRFGPDLSNVGARSTASQIGAVVTGLGDHPSLALAAEDLEDLVAYLLESRTLGTAAENDVTGTDGVGDTPAGEEPAQP